MLQGCGEGLRCQKSVSFCGLFPSYRPSMPCAVEGPPLGLSGVGEAVLQPPQPPPPPWKVCPRLLPQCLPDRDAQGCCPSACVEETPEGFCGDPSPFVVHVRQRRHGVVFAPWTLRSVVLLLALPCPVLSCADLISKWRSQPRGRSSAPRCWPLPSSTAVHQRRRKLWLWYPPSAMALRRGM